MNKYEMIEKLEINFQKINGIDSKLWVYDLLGFIYGNMSDLQLQQLVARSEKRVWEHEQYMNQLHELQYETEAGK